MRRRLLILAAQLALFAAVVALWEVGSTVRLADDRFLVDPSLFSRPSRILSRDLAWVQDGTIAGHVAVTLYEAAGGFVAGVVGGVVAGFMLGRSDFWARVLGPYIRVLNALPRLIFAPVLILLLGLDERSKIALAFSLVFVIVFFDAFRGVRDVDRNVLANARMLGASERQLTRHVLLPSAMTWILTSLHTSVGFAMVGAVVGEYIGAARGIGHVVAQAEGNLDATGVWAGMVVLSVLVVILELVVMQVERRLVRWKRRAGAELLAA